MEDFLDYKKYLLENVLNTTENYKASSKKLLIQLANFPEQYTSHLVPILEEIFENYTTQRPILLLNSLRFLKEMMDMKSMTIATKVEKAILPHLITFAHFRINDKDDDDRGRFLFVPVQSPKLLEYEEKEQFVIGNSFFRLCLECLLMWRLFYPRTEFEYQAEALLKEGVKFPSDIYYFKKYETYLKSPKDKSRFPNINLQESNDSPDNLFEGYQSEFEVLQKTERGLEEFEIIKKDFQRYLFFSDGNIIGNKQFTKIMDKLQESAKKAFKMMEMVMHATLDEKVYHKFMSFLFENNDFCEEVIEDFKQMSNNTLNQAVFIAKYRTNMSSDGSSLFNKKSSKIFFNNDKNNKPIDYSGIEKINDRMLTKEQFLDLIKDSNSLKNRIESNNNHKSNEKIAVLNEPKGKFFTESEEIPTENRKAIENREHSMNGLALKNVDFTESLSNDQVPSHYIYLEKQFPALKITVNSPVQNSRTIKPKDFVVKEKEPIFGEKTINRVNIMIGSNSDLLEERDKISNLDELYNSIKNVNLKNDSNDLPSFGFNNFGSQMGFGSNVSLEADYVKEKKKLLGDLEILQQKEREIEKKRKNLHESEQRNCLLRSIKEKNQKINIMKQKFRDFRKMNEAVGNENAYLKQLQQKHYELQCDNRLFKHLLKISSITNLNGFSSVNSGSAQKPPKIVVSSVNHRKNSSRSFKMDDRGSAPSGEIEKMSVGLKKNSDNFFLKDIEFTTNLQENVQRLKICCLKNKGLLFKNQEIQIGVLSDLQNYKEKKLWKIYIYVENISQNNMITNIFMRFKASDNITLWAKSQEEFINVLRYQEQNYKEIVIDYKTIPFNFALLDIKYQYLNKITRNIIALPNSIIKLVNFLEIEIQELIDFWKKNKQSSKNSEEFQINPNFSNFKTFFPFLSEKISQNIKKEDLDKKVFYSKFKVLGVEGIIKLKSNFHQKNTGKITGVLKIMLVDNNKENPLNLRDFLLDSFKFLLVKV